MIRFGRKGSRSAGRGVLGQVQMQDGRGVVSKTFPGWPKVRTMLETQGLQDDDVFHDEMDYSTAESQEERVEETWVAMKSRWVDFTYAAEAFTAPLRLWRMVKARSPEAIRTQGLGVYWSWSPSAAEAHYGSGSGEDWLLVGEADPTDVDWSATFYANVELPDECEIQLKPGTPVRLLHVRHSATEKKAKTFPSDTWGTA